jgi:hypothetical protein
MSKFNLFLCTSEHVERAEAELHSFLTLAFILGCGQVYAPAA